MDKKENKYISSFINKNHVVEMLYDEKKNETNLAVFSGGKTEITKSILIDGVNLKPL